MQVSGELGMVDNSCGRGTGAAASGNAGRQRWHGTGSIADKVLPIILDVNGRET
jgi:hypothetical protein